MKNRVLGTDYKETLSECQKKTRKELRVDLTEVGTKHFVLKLNMDSERIPRHAKSVTAWISERTTINKHFPCMEDYLHLVQRASIQGINEHGVKS